MENIETVISKAKEKQIPVVLVPHISKNPQTPFFVKSSLGAYIRERIMSLVPDAPVVIKEQADSFYETALESILVNLGATDMLVCGMMTQNCVTHTAITKSSDKYWVSILRDCCATASEIINAITLRAFTIRVPAISIRDM